MSDLEAPASLDLLDVAGNGMDCERFLWIRALSDPNLPRKERIDLVDGVRRHPGAMQFLASRDGTTAASTFTARDAAGAGGCYLSVFNRSDPGEPVLGDLVAFASAQAAAVGVTDVRCGDAIDRPHMQALLDRHDFTEHERWRRFHVDVDTASSEDHAIPQGLHASTLAEREDLAADAFRVRHEGLVDAAGDFPRPDETVDSWLRDMDGSPVLGRDLVLLLHDDAGTVHALAQLELRAARSDRAEVDFLAVDRTRRGDGLAAIAKQRVVGLAKVQGLRRLETMNHADNELVCRLNERLGWTEDPVYVQLRRPVP